MRVEVVVGRIGIPFQGRCELGHRKKTEILASFTTKIHPLASGPTESARWWLVLRGLDREAWKNECHR